MKIILSSVLRGISAAHLEAWIEKSLRLILTIQNNTILNYGYSYSISDQGAMYFITCTVSNWVDVFTRSMYSEIVEDSLNYCIDKKSLTVFGYVIMSNHIHLLVQAKQNNLSDIIRDFKKFTSQRIISAIEHNESESRRRWLLWLFTKENATDIKPVSYRFWRADNHAVECLTLQFIWQKLNYIHDNPVRCGIVKKAEEYLKSSAADYFYGKQVGRIKIEMIDPLIVIV